MIKLGTFIYSFIHFLMYSNLTRVSTSVNKQHTSPGKPVRIFAATAWVVQSEHRKLNWKQLAVMSVESVSL